LRAHGRALVTNLREEAVRQCTDKAGGFSRQTGRAAEVVVRALDEPAKDIRSGERRAQAETLARVEPACKLTEPVPVQVRMGEIDPMSAGKRQMADGSSATQPWAGNRTESPSA
jgi:hypothetical protein